MSGLTDQEIEVIARRIVADIGTAGPGTTRERTPQPNPAAELGVFEGIDEAIRAANAAFQRRPGSNQRYGAAGWLEASCRFQILHPAAQQGSSTQGRVPGLS